MLLERTPVMRARWLAPLAFVLAAAAAGAAAQDAELPWELGEYEGVPWPIIPPPIAGPLPRSPTFTSPGSPATTAAERVIERVEAIRTSLRETAYEHATVVDEDDGVYRFDCSGMVAWVLRRAAPRAMRVSDRDRWLASHFVREIERAPVGRSRRGWERVPTLAEARPGDLFAWRRPRGFPSRSTGHVGFVLAAPAPVPGLPGALAVRIADSSSYVHQDDTRLEEGPGGFGTGTISFLVDEEGEGTAYGWWGTVSEGYVVTPIVIGRVH